MTIPTLHLFGRTAAVSLLILGLPWAGQAQSDSGFLSSKRSFSAPTAEKSLVTLELELQYSLPQLPSLSKRTETIDRSSGLLELAERVCRKYLAGKRYVELFGNPANQQCISDEAKDLLYREGQKLGLILEELRVSEFRLEVDAAPAAAPPAASPPVQQSEPPGRFPKAYGLVIAAAGLLLLVGAGLLRSRPKK